MAVFGSSTRPVAREITRSIGLPGAGILVAAVLAAAALAPVVQTSDATNTGRRIRDLEAQRSHLEAQIAILQADVAALGASDRVDREARERLGMIPTDRRIYVPVSRAASPLQMPSRFAPPEQAPRTDNSEPWWKLLLP